MRRLLLLLAGLLTFASVSAQKPVNLLGKSVRYVGAVVDKLPEGEGIMTIKNGDDTNEYLYTLQGTFTDGSVSDATFTMESQGVTFSGDVSYVVDKKLKATIVSLRNGEIRRGSETIAVLNGDETFALTIPTKGVELTGQCTIEVECSVDEKYIALAKRAVDCDSYTNCGGVVTLTASTAMGVEVSGWDKITTATLSFSNKATASIDKSGNMTIKRTNGDVIKCSKDKILEFSIAIKEGRICHDNIWYSFANGAKYNGSYRNLAPTTIDELIDLKSIEWKWDDTLFTHMDNGELVYANGSTLSLINSSLDFNLKCKYGRITPHKMYYTFPNGVKYEGDYNRNVVLEEHQALLYPEDLELQVESLDDWIVLGKLTLDNGICLTVAQGKPIELPDVINVGDIKLIIRDPKRQFNYSLIDIETKDTSIYMSFGGWSPTLDEIINLEKCIDYKWCLKYGLSGNAKFADGTFFQLESYYGHSEIEGDYKIVYENGYISNNSISYTFANGNHYSGTTRGIVVTPQMLIDYDGWKWEDFNQHVNTGVLTLADGTKKSYEFSIEKSKLAAQKQRWEQAKKRDVTRYYHNYYYGKRISYMRHTYLDLSYVEYNEDSGKDYLYFNYANGDRAILRMSSYSKLEQFRDDTNALPPHINSFISRDIDVIQVVYNDGLTIQGSALITSTPLGHAYYSTNYRDEGLTLKKVDYAKDGVTYHQNYIKFADGRLFDGEYRLQFDKTIVNPLNDEQRLKIRKIKLNSSPEAIVGVEFYDGALFDAQGKVIEIYQNGNKLSTSETIRLESQYKQKRERREKIDKFVAKGYNQYHVEQVVDGYIPIGAPIKLLVEYHGSSKIKASGWYDDGHEYRSYTGLGRHIAVDSKGTIVEHSRAY